MSGAEKTAVLCANAKINLWLEITGRRADGYHLIETVMQSVDLCDVVTVSIGGGEGEISVGCSDPLIPSGKDNICFKAATSFLKAAEKPVGRVSVFIEKRIPSGAGLGGGSADAAAVLCGLNALYGEPLDEGRLLEAAAAVGADVPFCCVGGTRLCRGIGEIMLPVEPLTEGAFLVVMPSFACGTAEAYALYDKNPPPRRLFPDVTARRLFGGMMYNVFEALYADPRIEQIKSRLLSAGAGCAMLTGSGSAVFGTFSDEVAAARAAGELAGLFAAVCRPTSRGIVEVS